LETVGHRSEIGFVAYRPDGRRVASFGADGTIRIWDTSSGRLVQALMPYSEFNNCWGLRWSPDGQVLAIGTGPNYLTLCEADTGRRLKSLAGLLGSVGCLSWSPDGRRCAAATHSPARICVWDLEAGAAPLVLEGHQGTCAGMAWSPDGTALACIGSDNTLRLWDPSAAKPERTIDLPPSVQLANPIAWSPDGRYVGTIRLLDEKYVLCAYDVAKGSVVRALTLPIEHCSLAWSPSGKLVATGSYHSEPAVKVWDLIARQEVWQAKARCAGLGLAFSPDGVSLALGTLHGDVCLYDAGSGRETWSVPGQCGSVGTVFAALSPDGRHFVSAHFAPKNNAVRLWDTDSGRILRELPAGNQFYGPGGASWSPDGTLVAASVYGHGVWLWRTDGGTAVRKLLAQPSGNERTAWSPNGVLLATVNSERAVQVWEVGSGKLRRTLPGKGGRPAFSPDGRWLAVAVDRDVQCYDAGTGEPGPVFAGADRPVDAVAWSPDGKTLAAATDSRRLFLWDTQARKLKQECDLGDVPGSSVGLLSWTEDGSALIAGGHWKLSLYDVKRRAVTQTAPGRFCPRFPSASRETIAVPGPSLIDLRGTRDLRLRQTILSLRDSQSAVVSPQGHWRGSPNLEKEFVYVVLCDDGRQLTLTPEEFATKYGWKNDPEKAALKAEGGK
jgi:WD40 repeat protein